MSVDYGAIAIKKERINDWLPRASASSISRRLALGSISLKSNRGPNNIMRALNKKRVSLYSRSKRTSYSSLSVLVLSTQESAKAEVDSKSVK